MMDAQTENGLAESRSVGAIRLSLFCTSDGRKLAALNGGNQFIPLHMSQLHCVIIFPYTHTLVVNLDSRAMLTGTTKRDFYWLH
jgi:hypothetical protein